MQGKEVAVRLVSALVLGAFALFITWYNPISFDAMCLLASVLLAREWWGLTHTRSRWFVLLGAVYIGAATGSLIFLRAQDVAFVYFLFALVWAADIAAYIVGKTIGRHKIAPSISPGKTWEGLLGGVVASIAVMRFVGHIAPWLAAFAGLIFAVVGLAGDLFESSLKRRAGVKDSRARALIPGHGGLFDRVDALLPCALLMAACVRLLMMGD